MPLRTPVASAQQLARRQADEMRAEADARFGHAAQVVIGICTTYNSDLAQLTVRELGNQLTFTASAVGMTVTAARLLGRLVLCWEDPGSRLVWLRMVFEGAA